MRFHLWLGFVIAIFAGGSAAIGEPLSLHERIDGIISTANLEANQPVAGLADDAEFFRRVNLDLSGVVPTAKAVQAFLSDNDPGKRTKIIDRLLSDSDNYSRRMREEFHVQLMERRGDDKTWETWLEKSFAENKPWDQMTREIIRADFRDEPNRGAAFFYTKRLQKTGAQPTDHSGVTRDVGRLFLGIDLQCAECHNHRLIDDYDQVDFQGLFAGFSKLKLLNEPYPAVEEQLLSAKQEYASVFTGVPREVAPKVPGFDEIELAVFTKGEEYIQPPDRKTKTPGIPKFSPLAGFAKLIPESPNFSKNITNRLWYLMMGRGLVEPLDQFHSENPPSHPELLDIMAQELTAHQYDIKWLIRELALTQTYQRSSKLPEGVTSAPPERFSVAVQRRLSAEQLLWSTIRATGHTPEDVPLENIKAEQKDAEDFIGLRSRFASAFANEPKEPEREFSPSVKGALFMMNDPEVLKLVESMSDREVTVENLYLQIFSSYPDAAELAEGTQYLDKAANRKAALRDLAWAMLTSTEFVVNH
ncbi:MAG: DUF1553 domain-containing protein [Verrucomicrobiales bacterium]|nr:DUF1553 domain-containing protein [Verrucomicrobiales bacterium]